MLIFDGFPDRQHAESFVVSVKERYNLEATVFNTVKDAQESDPIPVRLKVPIVHVQRWRDEEDYQRWLRGTGARERNIRRMGKNHGGRFAGT